MPRRRNPVPTYCLHKPTGQAYVRIPDGAGGRRPVYLGPYGSPESTAEYERLLAELRTAPANSLWVYVARFATGDYACSTPDMVTPILLRSALQAVPAVAVGWEAQAVLVVARSRGRGGEPGAGAALGREGAAEPAAAPDAGRGDSPSGNARRAAGAVERGVRRQRGETWGPSSRSRRP